MSNFVRRQDAECAHEPLKPQIAQQPGIGLQAFRRAHGDVQSRVAQVEQDVALGGQHRAGDVEHGPLPSCSRNAPWPAGHHAQGAPAIGSWAVSMRISGRPAGSCARDRRARTRAQGPAPSAPAAPATGTARVYTISQPLGFQRPPYSRAPSPLKAVAAKRCGGDAPDGLRHLKTKTPCSMR